MKRNGTRHLLMAVVTLLLATGIAQAQGNIAYIYVADIPFSFTVDNVTLPAGQYEITQLMKTDAWDFSIANAKGDVKVVVATEPAGRPDMARTFELSFDQFGDKHFLNTIWLADTPYGFYIPKTGEEKTMMKDGTSPKSRSVKLNKK